VIDPARFAHDLGATLRQVRMDQRLTQKELADRIGVTRASLANIEAGRQRMSVYILARAAAALETSPNTLLPQSFSVAGEPALGGRVPKNLPDSHRQLVDRLLASAAHVGDSDASTETQHRRGRSSRAS
jgi:transcriptional regulator with XRE-family HTH domain